MARNKIKQMPRLKSLDTLVEFFDTHDLGEYLDEMPEVQFDVEIKKRRHLFVLEDELVDRLTKIAKTKKISSSALISSWLREKVQGQP
jgi:hypothetical protein